MFSQAIRYLVPVGVGVAVYLPTTVYAKSEADGCKKKNISPADVYDEPATVEVKQEDCRVTELEKCVKICREGLGPVKDDVAKFSTQATSFYKDTMAIANENLTYLQKKAPEEVKYATIAGSGLVGLLLAARKGVFKKIIYVAITAGGAYSVIYPQEAKKYSCEGLQMAKKYGAIAYNFIVMGPGAEQPKKLCPVRRNNKEKEMKEKECPTDPKS